MENRSVALDGPAGAGKSTLAKRVSEHFGLIYVDTGALYRSIGLFVFRNNVASRDAEGVLKLLPEIRLDMRYDDSGVQRMILNGEDVTEDIRLPEISVYASDVSAMPAVREFLLEMQRSMAVKYNVLMDGRDIGTVVLPDAGLKVFITADASTRANRRYLELKAKGIETTFDEVKDAMIKRDKNDSEREAAPLKAADDAVILDTSELNLDESFDALCNLVTAKFGEK
ncbi:MAG: (d)CMP kinase [Oscillospiraceae bacterium]|nr:(d)CMP kinase [Oscillospiraceae bacterium]